MERTPAYIATVNFELTATKQEKLNTVKMLKELFKNPRGVRIRGRLGRNNPYADLYRRGGAYYRYSSQEIRPEHSQRVDIYFKA